MERINVESRKRFKRQKRVSPDVISRHEPVMNYKQGNDLGFDQARVKQYSSQK